MSEFIVAIGLVLVIEGLVFAGFPAAAKRLAAILRDAKPAALGAIVRRQLLQLNNAVHYTMRSLVRCL